MSDPKRILILTAEVGFGHLHAAQAIAAAFAARYPDDAIVEIANPMNDDSTPGFVRSMQDRYDDDVQNPAYYEWVYSLGNTPLASRTLGSVIGLALQKPVRKALDAFQPDAIITTTAHYLASLATLWGQGARRVPVVTVVTDLTTVHRLWFNPVSSITCVPTQAALLQGTRHKIPVERCQVTGVPVDPAIVDETRDPATLRRALGWDPDLTTLVVVGSERVRGTVDALRGLNHAGLPLQLALIAGGHKPLYEHYQAHTWHPPTHIYNYVDGMAQVLNAADIVVSKAGGLIVSESLALGKPMLLIDVIEGQETGNADFIIAEGAAERADGPLDALEIVYHWLADDRALLRERASNARRIGHPQSAFSVAQATLNLVHA